MKRIFFSVGEPSGDLHGSNLIRQLKSLGEPVECVGFGGPKMRDAGLDQHYDLTQHALMMLVTILKKLRFFFSLVDQAEEYLKSHQVDAVVLIDYPGFNWHIAKRAKKLGIPVFYYGVPQVWAWAPWRIRKIRQRVDYILCKLPFEKSWFEARGCKATYVGHPFFDQLVSQEYDQAFLRAFQTHCDERPRIDRRSNDRPLESEGVGLPRTLGKGCLTLPDDSMERKEGSKKLKGPSKVLLLLPGSRNREVRDNLPGMLASAKIAKRHVPDLRVAIGFFNQKQCDAAKELIAEQQLDCELYVNRTAELMTLADACIACSGSVSLELMYHRVPTVIVYKIGRIPRVVEKFLIRSRYITLVNLLRANKITKDGLRTYNPDAKGAEPVPMPEYLYSGDRSVNVARRVIDWLNDEDKRRQSVEELDRLANEFAIAGASQRAANFIADRLGVQHSRRAAA